MPVELSDMNTQVWASFDVSWKIYECFFEREFLKLSNGVMACKGSTHALQGCCDLTSLLLQLPLCPHFLNSFFPFFTLLLNFFLSLLPFLLFPCVSSVHLSSSPFVLVIKSLCVLCPPSRTQPFPSSHFVQGISLFISLTISASSNAFILLRESESFECGISV